MLARRSAFKSTGVGTDIRIESDRVQGFALEGAEGIVHLAAFAG